MPLSDDRRPWQGGLASLVVGLGRDVAPLNHLAPHNALEWVLYLGATVVLLAVGLRVIGSADDALPRRRKPHEGKADRGRNGKSPGGPQKPGSDGQLDDRGVRDRRSE